MMISSESSWQKEYLVVYFIMMGVLQNEKKIILQHSFFMYFKISEISLLFQKFLFHPLSIFWVQQKNLLTMNEYF